MKSKTILTFIFFVSIHMSDVFAQNSYIIGTKSYLSTPNFKLFEYYESFAGRNRRNPVEIAFGINGKETVIIISKTEMTWGLNFKGNLVIYLDDGNVITCIDRGVKDKVNNIISAVYRLTAKEVEMIIESNINGIRYSLGYESSNLENYLVYNSDFEEKSVLSMATGSKEGKLIERINFSEELKKLF